MERLVKLILRGWDEEPTDFVPPIVLYDGLRVLVFEFLLVHLLNDAVSGSADRGFLFVVVVQDITELVCIGVTLVVSGPMESIEKTVIWWVADVGTEFPVLWLLGLLDLYHNICGVGHLLFLLLFSFDFFIILELHDEGRVFQPFSLLLFRLLFHHFLCRGLTGWVAEIRTFGFFVVAGVSSLTIGYLHQVGYFESFKTLKSLDFGGRTLCTRITGTDGAPRNRIVNNSVIILGFLSLGSLGLPRHNRITDVLLWNALSFEQIVDIIRFPDFPARGGSH